MIEKKIYQEIPGGRNKFHSAVLTSFSFNFHHFENQVLRTLRQKWVSSIMILADQRMLDNELGVASGNLKYLSQSYSVSGIEAKGAFHPKINFLIGDHQLLLLFGSGNITPGGHGKNHEIFTGFYADMDNSAQLPLIIEAWNYLLSIVKQIEGYNRDRLFRVIPGACDLLKGQVTSRNEFYRLDDEMEVALLYHNDSTIFEQIAQLIPRDEVNEITVVSPYFDEDGKTLLKLKNQFNRAKIDVFLPSEYGLPPIRMKDHEAISFYNWDKTIRGKQSISSSEEYYRKLHSKVFHFKTNDHEYCVIGSANATMAGLGGENVTSVNEEFCALYKIANTGLLQELGITGTKKTIALEKLSRNNSIITDLNKIVHTKKAHILCADLSGRRLEIKYRTGGSGYQLSIFDSNGNRLISDLFEPTESNTTILYLTDDVLNGNPSFVVFESEVDNEISNKQLINYIDKLVNTDPSRGNRTIRQVLTSLESGTINEFEIIDFINDLNKSKDTSLSSKATRGGSSREHKGVEDISVAEMSYNEAVEAARDNQKSEIIVRGHSSIRLWETISRLFQEKHKNVGEELMDEEEEGSAESSRERKEANLDEDKVVVRGTDHFRRIVNSISLKSAS